MSVSVDVGFAHDPTGTVTVPGGDGAIRIRVDGELLTDLEGDDREALTMWKTLYDHRGEELDRRGFVGAWFEFELGRLKDALVRIDDGDVDRFEEVGIRVSDDFADRYALVLSFVDAEHVRLAYQVRQFADADAEVRPPTRCARGYAVELDDLCDELIDCYEGWKAYVDVGRDDGDDPFFDDQVAALEAARGGSWWTEDP